MKTNFQNDLSKSYSHLDIVLVRYRGFWNFLSRVFKGQIFDTAFIVIRDPIEGKLGLYGVNHLTEKFELIHSINQWKGILSSQHPTALVVNLPAHPETGKRAVNAIGQDQFDDTYDAVAWVFEMNPAKSGESQILSHRIK